MTITLADAQLGKRLEELACARGESIDRFVEKTLRATLAADQTPSPRPIDWAAVRRIQQEIAAAPDLETGSPDELLGYDDDGLPTR